jgi:hypothetical protein
MKIHEAASASEQIDTEGIRGEDTPGYRPIENYGIIGDLHTTALVGMDGTIDWLCLPHHDSPSVFAAILDSEKGGQFKISPVGGEVTTKQLYWPGTTPDRPPRRGGARHHGFPDGVLSGLRLRPQRARDQDRRPRGDLPLPRAQPGAGVVLSATTMGRWGLRGIHAARRAVYGLRAQGDRSRGGLRG